MDTVYRPFEEVEQARFVDRPNRFLVRCDRKGERIIAALPNPGRLLELLLPGSLLYLAREESSTRKTRFTVVGVERNGLPVMLHTHLTNVAVQRLLEERLVPGLEDARIEKREVTVGGSRFDFLLNDGKGHILLEVKSCTLFGERVAMFPDAVTARGTRHLRELGRLAMEGQRAAVIFVVQWPKADVFMPDYHTDLSFARALLEVGRRIRILPIAVEWLPGLHLSRTIKVLDVPWDYIEEEAVDKGSYIFVLELPEDKHLRIGKSGVKHFPKGFYLYVGSAMANLTARMSRHLRLRKGLHWHIDWLRPHATVHAMLPIRSSAPLECDIARKLSTASDWSVAGFGCSDCTCESHLFGMREDPLARPSFHAMLEYFRMDRFGEVFRKEGP